MAFVDYYNPTTGETWSAPSGGWTAPEGWEIGSPPGGLGNTLDGTVTPEPVFYLHLQCQSLMDSFQVLILKILKILTLEIWTLVTLEIWTLVTYQT
jgi:hypothetical protein